MRQLLRQGITGCAIAVVCCCVASAQQTRVANPTFMIDLLTLQRADDKGSQNGDVAEQDRLGLRVEGRGTPTHSVASSTQLEMTLESIDRHDYRLGDPMIYEVVVRNTGGHTVPFPSSVQARRFSRGMSGARWAAVSLQVESETLGRQLVGSDLLYGADAVTGSLIHLAPGQSVRIRVPGTWFFRSAFPTSAPGHWTSTAEVKAILQIHEDKEQLPVITSTNSEKVIINR